MRKEASGKVGEQGSATKIVWSLLGLTYSTPKDTQDTPQAPPPQTQPPDAKHLKQLPFVISKYENWSYLPAGTQNTVSLEKVQLQLWKTWHLERISIWSHKRVSRNVNWILLWVKKKKKKKHSQHNVQNDVCVCLCVCVQTAQHPREMVRSLVNSHTLSR